MVDLVTPLVLVSALVVLVAFVGLWYYRFAELPPVRAAVAVALAGLFFVYSLVSLSTLAADPAESVAILLAVLLVLAAVQYVQGRVRG